MVSNRDNIIILLSYIYQYGVFFYAVSKCLKEEKKDINKWIASIFICIFMIIALSCMLESRVMVIIEVHSLSFFLICGISKKEKIYDSMYAHSLCYYGCLIYLIVQDTLFGVRMTFNIMNLVSGLLFMGVYLYSVKGMVELFNEIRNEEQYRTFVIIFSFIIDVFLMFDEIAAKAQVRMLQVAVFNMCFIFFIMYAVYFAIRYIKVKKIIHINTKLNYVNNELRNIKDNHRRMINIMIDLYEQNQNEEIGIMLKKIINNGNSEVKLSGIEEKKDNSILDIASIGAIKDGITVNIDEEYSLELVRIDKMELYRIISNIISNARRVLNGAGIINIKTYRSENNIIITIDNTGPKIDDDHIEKIFKAGFTTKNNKDKSHGYGLNIVKELVEKNQGYINVESSEVITVFKIILPCI